MTLGWNDGPDSSVEGKEYLEAESPTPPTSPLTSSVRFLAGRDWRLLGTYNALDAQRVFRFGQALGRRFVRVPVPLISDEQFRDALDADLDGLPPKVGETIAGLYAAHRGTNAPLGPALFLWMPNYVRAGLHLLGGTTTVGEEEAEKAKGVGEAEQPLPIDEGTASADNGQPPAVPTIDVASEEDIRDLLAETYLVAAGAWLSRLDDADLEAVRGRIVTTNLLTEGQWEWLRDLLPSLG